MLCIDRISKLAACALVVFTLCFTACTKEALPVVEESFSEKLILSEVEITEENEINSEAETILNMNDQNHLILQTNTSKARCANCPPPPPPPPIGG